MAYELSDLLVVGISSRALFDLEEEDRIFRAEGLQAFIRHQREHEDEILKPGAAFPLIQGLLSLNDGQPKPRVEVILMSQNHPDVSLRVLNSISRHGLKMSRAALSGGASIAPYLKPFSVGLFLSQERKDVQRAADQGVAAGLIYPPPPEMQTAPKQIRIAFDGDCVLFSDEAQKVYDGGTLEDFHEFERSNAKRQLPPGPFANFVRFLSDVQDPDPDKSPVRTALVTDRNMPAHERALLTLRAWGVRIDEAFLLGGVRKEGILSAFGAHMFFDDKEEYCDRASATVPTGRVFLPTPSAPVIETTIKVEVNLGAGGKEEFLFACRNYLKQGYSQAETELSSWYDLKLHDWPQANRVGFVEELNRSVKGTPRGNQRRAQGDDNTAASKLKEFLRKLQSKHRPK